MTTMYVIMQERSTWNYDPQAGCSNEELYWEPIKVADTREAAEQYIKDQETPRYYSIAEVESIS